MIRTIPIPDGFSIDLPDHNLIFNISPFPVIRPITQSDLPYEVEDHLIWVQLDINLYGLFDRKILNIHRCPTCGQEWKREGEAS